MSESKTECPICHRQPGERHRDACKRSSFYMRAFSQALKMRKLLGIEEFDRRMAAAKKAMQQ